jgi:hypothetical protein
MKLTDVAIRKKKKGKNFDDREGRIKNNPVAKNMGVNRAATHRDRKQAAKNPRKSQKHKGKMFESLDISGN